jgi:putative tricarboxylic transport membrane protein
LSLIGAFSVSGRIFDLWVAIAAGLFGFVLRLAKVPLAPVVIGLVLGPIFEESLRQGLIIKGGNFLSFFGLEHPISLVLMVVTLLIIFSAGRKEFLLFQQNKV